MMHLKTMFTVMLSFFLLFFFYIPFFLLLLFLSPLTTLPYPSSLVFHLLSYPFLFLSNSSSSLSLSTLFLTTLSSALISPFFPFSLSLHLFPINQTTSMYSYCIDTCRVWLLCPNDCHSKFMSCIAHLSKPN